MKPVVARAKLAPLDDDDDDDLAIKTGRNDCYFSRTDSSTFLHLFTSNDYASSNKRGDFNLDL